MPPFETPITARQLLAVVDALSPGGPITERWFRRRCVEGGAKKPKEAWTDWLTDYDRPGYYRRKEPGLFARQVYTQLKSPWMMLWLCEKLGASENELRAAAAAADQAVTRAAQAGAFRRVIPWERIQSLLERGSPRALSRKAHQRRIKTPQALRRVVARLSPESPITDRFSRQWRSLADRDGGQQERRRVWYKTQHEHWLGWLNGWRGPGAYSRKDWNRSAEFVYDHIVNPQMLVYLAEAAGVNRESVTVAVKAALEDRGSMPSMSAAIRRIIPWETVESALLNRHMT